MDYEKEFKDLLDLLGQISHAFDKIENKEVHPEPKFKVGDIVRFITNVAPYHNLRGFIKEIKHKPLPDYPYFVEFDNNWIDVPSTWVREIDIEAYVEEHEFNVGDVVIYDGVNVEFEEYKGAKAVIIKIDDSFGPEIPYEICFCEYDYPSIWVNGKDIKHYRETKNEKFTEDEKTILRNIPDEYKWIARDEDGELFVYTVKPTRFIARWDNDDNIWSSWSWVAPIRLDLFEHLFKSITFDDEEPCEFRKYLD